MCNSVEYINTMDCVVTLQNKQLWKLFHKDETEMIITKNGRRMFPIMRVQISGLDPNSHYCVFLEIMPVSNYRFKYTANSGWTPSGVEETHNPHRLHLHPDSPSTGEHWMSQAVSFGRLKLTNNPTPQPGQIVLSSMHKYQMRIIIAKTMDPRHVCVPTVTATFEETTFIAVTAYQNDKITKLKIDYNPFAKGFRTNGQSKSRRKTQNVEEPTSTERENSSPMEDDRNSSTSSPEASRSQHLLQKTACCSNYQPIPTEYPYYGIPYTSPMYRPYSMCLPMGPRCVYNYQQQQFCCTPPKYQPPQLSSLLPLSPPQLPSLLPLSPPQLPSLLPLSPPQLPSLLPLSPPQLPSLLPLSPPLPSPSPPPPPPPPPYPQLPQIELKPKSTENTDFSIKAIMNRP